MALYIWPTLGMSKRCTARHYPSTCSQPQALWMPIRRKYPLCVDADPCQPQHALPDALRPVYRGLKTE